MPSRSHPAFLLGAMAPNKKSKSKHASGSDSESDIMMGVDEESSDSVSAKSEGVKDLQKTKYDLHIHGPYV